MLVAARYSLLAALRAAPTVCARACAGAPAAVAARPPPAAAAIPTRHTSRGFAADAAIEDDAAATSSSISVTLVDGQTGTHRGTTTLPSDVFSAPIRTDILHRVIRWQQAKARAGTGAAKNRAAVRGGGRNPGNKRARARRGRGRFGRRCGWAVARRTLPRRGPSNTGATGGCGARRWQQR